MPKRGPTEHSTLELTVSDVAPQRRTSLLIHHDGGAEVVPLIEGTPVVVGRKPPSDVVVPDQSLSKTHAKFVLRNGAVILRDLGSTNGCSVDGRHVEEATITEAHAVRLGAVIATVHIIDESAKAVSDELNRIVAGDAIVRSPAMEDVYAMAQRVANSTLPILIHGETGVGKEVLARAIHAAGTGGSEPMRCLNCGAVPRELLESALFGHEQGAFTGANEARAGIFEEAGAGTVLLDEIGELSPTAQVALLRILEERHVRRLGGAKEIAIQSRVIAATHRDLEQMIEAGNFREDLFFRLNALTLVIPPLRERREEIKPLAEMFAKAAATREDRPLPKIDASLESWMENYDWPGNVRELRNIIERAVLMAQTPLLTTEHLPKRVANRQNVPGPRASREETAAGLKDRVQDYERNLIVEALNSVDWNQSAAARKLKMPVRTLTSKMKSYGIVRPNG